MSWTEPDDVLKAWIGDDQPTDVSLVQNWINKAERLLRSRIPGLAERITANEPDLLDNTVDIVSAMVIRVFRNPAGIRQVSEGTGPFTESRTYGGDNPGELHITASELDRLSGVSGGVGAFSIGLIPTSSPFHPAYRWWPFDEG